MKGKNGDLDRYYSQLRAPLERVFSQDIEFFLLN